MNCHSSLALKPPQIHPTLHSTSLLIYRFLSLVYSIVPFLVTLSLFKILYHTVTSRNFVDCWLQAAWISYHLECNTKASKPALDLIAFSYHLWTKFLWITSFHLFLGPHLGWNTDNQLHKILFACLIIIIIIIILSTIVSQSLHLFLTFNTVICLELLLSARDT